MRSFWAFIFLLVISAITISRQPPNGHGDIIYDVSWPNCGAAKLELSSGIVGITGGLSFHPNPCLASEVSWFKHVSVYMNTGYPGLAKAKRYASYPKKCSANNERCIAYNYGFNSGRYSLDQALRSGVLADRWWLDVETVNSWSSDPDINRAVLTGTVEAISRPVGKDKIGFYSYPGQWDQLTGKWKNGYPVWVATGSTNLAEALKACSSPSFTDGPVLLTQYTPKLDENLLCKPSAI